jgi:hypothetical protein
LAYVGSNGDVFYAVTNSKIMANYQARIWTICKRRAVDVDLAKRNPWILCCGKCQS